MKPSQMREKMALMERLNAANRNNATRFPPYQRRQLEEGQSNEKMPSLYQQFAPPPRPKKN